jgi:hypothetical protein
MGSTIDAAKLVSCMTLFRSVARAEQAKNPRLVLGALAGDADAILEAAASQGYDHCAFTETQLQGVGM